MFDTFCLPIGVRSFFRPSTVTTFTVSSVGRRHFTWMHPAGRLWRLRQVPQRFSAGQPSSMHAVPPHCFGGSDPGTAGQTGCLGNCIGASQCPIAEEGTDKAIQCKLLGVYSLARSWTRELKAPDLPLEQPQRACQSPVTVLWDLFCSPARDFA